MKWLTLLLILLAPAAMGELVAVPNEVVLGDEITFRVEFPGDLNGTALLDVGDGRSQEIAEDIGYVDMIFDATTAGRFTATLTYVYQGQEYVDRASYVVLTPEEAGATQDAGAPLGVSVPLLSIIMLLIFARRKT